MAFANFGAWALVGQQLASAVLSVVLLWAVSPWRPSFAFSAPDFRALFGYSVNVVGGDFLGFLSRNMDNLLIGVFLGPVQLGFYAVAYRILDTSQQVLLSAARRLVFPSLARLQHDMDRLRRAYMRLSQLSGTATMPSYLGLALVAPEAVTVIFGQKWTAAGVAASILFLIGPVQTIQSFSGAAWNAVGHPEVTLRFRLVATVTNVTGFLIAVLVFRDIVAVAAAYTIRGYALLPLNLYWMRHYVGLSIRELLLQLRGVAVATLVMAAAVTAVKFAIAGHVHNAVLLAVEVLAGAVSFTVGLFVVQRPLLLEVVGVAAQAIPGGERLVSRFGLPVHSRTDVELVSDVEPIGPDID
jgi:PST family polysaccharide transporter